MLEYIHDGKKVSNKYQIIFNKEKLINILGELIYSSINIRIYSNNQIFATHWYVFI